MQKHEVHWQEPILLASGPTCGHVCNLCPRAWQHPEKSLEVRAIAARLGVRKRYGLGGKVGGGWGARSVPHGVLDRRGMGEQ
jgi:hypothetical protein